MSGLLDLINSPMGKQLVSGVAGQTGQPEGKTADVLSMAMPLLMGAMKKNASTPGGAQGLMDALSSKHDGGILDDLGGLFGGGVDQNVMDDGAGILGHILGSKQPQVENALSRKSGIDAGTVSQILKIAAPIILGYLGKQTRQQNVSSPEGLNGLLGGLMGGGKTAAKQQSLVEAFLDSDGDGSVIDDLAGLALGGGQNKGGLGGMLGGLFGK
ncbi:DUF937 domain-containing protein [Flagellimonas halotolerans]|uniref:DUF937 domain-containing protein n=1 Tax=Flagellimonas halotolerans TaxID=3112164 RepID=A0ABU6INB3_9FLAO|nr:MULTISPECIES: DUF937 domain-containing protein [unclassified Allomuricauda]MEC3964657.1 DUF937 domain-containing protein [Muricauda sp. SYSU M86414]MEC4264526.1 DUF937 domain-containing protein [Muricauda sp. SYSU M84420]